MIKRNILKINKRLIPLFSLVAILFTSCCDPCPIQLNEAPNKCNSRIITIEKFNSHFTLVEGKDGKMGIKLDSNYSISMFKFPENANHSGSFPNDVRFEKSTSVAIAKLLFNDNNNYVTIEDIFPANNDMLGDILVKDVIINPTDKTAKALLRISGYIVPINEKLYTEDSHLFCEFLKKNAATIDQALQSIEQNKENLYGLNLGNKIISDYTKLGYKIYNKFNTYLGDQNTIGIPTPSSEILTKLKEVLAGKIGLDFEVRVGDFFGYITKSGDKFVFLVSDIRKSQIHPYRERVSIIFNEIK